MTYGFEERDYSLDKFEDSFTPEKPLLDLSGFRPTTPLVSAIRALGSPTAQAGYRGIASGLSLGLEVISDDEEVKDQTIFDYIVDGAAERAAKMRIDNEDFAKKQGLGGGIAYGLTYGLSGFFGTFGNPALYGQGLASARTKSELAAGVDPATAQKIGAIEGVTGAIGSVIPFFGKTLVQRLGFGAAANIIPGIGQRAAEAAVFGDRYASRAPEVFDPVAITVDALLGGSFGYLAGIADKPSSIPDQDINDALDLNVKVKQADSAPGMPNETSFAIHNKIMDEMVAARREYRQPDFRALADAEFKDSPEQIRQMQEALDEIEAWRGDDGEVKMMPSEVSDARRQIEPMYKRVLTDLEKTGRYAPEQSQQFAKLTSRVYRTLSKRTGMDVDELEAQFPLKTVMGSVEGVAGLGQREGLLPYPSTLTMPDVPTQEIMRQLSRKEKVPLTKAVSFQAARVEGQRDSKALIEGFGDLPVAVKLRTGEYVIYDGNHRTDAAIERGDEALDMHVIDAESYDPQNAGRRPAQEKLTDDELLAELLSQSALPNTIDIDGTQRSTLNSEGRPLAQTEEGVRNFWRWFGDSKVVDAQGKPLVVYHGTNADFEVFNTKGRGKTSGAGAFFTSNPAIADTYTAGQNANVAAVYLRISDMATIEAMGQNWTRLGKKTKVVLPKAVVSDKADADLLAALNGDQAEVGATKTLKARNTTLGRLFPDEFLYDDYFSTDDLSRWIGKTGYDGAVFTQILDRGANGRFTGPDTQVPSTVYTVFDPTQIKSATGNAGEFDPTNPSILAQQARGNYNPATQTINLSEISDPSTFVHELGHHLFEMLGKLAANPKAPKQIQDDFRALVEHGGMKVEAWYTASLETRRNAHERVAEDFETYLMDGSAPTPELKTMFGMIRDWMLEVYKTISGQVKPEIKAVFDRMLATDEQLAMKVMTPDYAAIAKRTEATKSMTLDNYLEEAKTTLDPESTVTIEGKPVKVADLLEDDPVATQEAAGMTKLVECMLNVR